MSEKHDARSSAHRANVVNASYIRTSELVQVTTALPQREYAKLVALARDAGLARSAYARKLLIRALREEARP